MSVFQMVMEKPVIISVWKMRILMSSLYVAMRRTFVQIMKIFLFIVAHSKSYTFVLLYQ